MILLVNLILLMSFKMARLIILSQKVRLKIQQINHFPTYYAKKKFRIKEKENFNFLRNNLRFMKIYSKTKLMY
jgi:hypothetical protein